MAAATTAPINKPKASCLLPPPTDNYCDWGDDLDRHPARANNFADDTSTVDKNRQSSSETSEDFISCLGDFGLDIHVGTAEKPNSKTVVVFPPCNKQEGEDQNQDPIALSSGAGKKT
jgi:hypothetical protein